MKKLVLSIVMICYLAVSTGVMVNSHYCMNKLASTQWFSSGSKKCGKCGMHMDKSHGCCRDEVSMVKMDDEHKQASLVVFELPALTLQAAEVSILNTPQTPVVILDQQRHELGSPPLLNSQDVYLENCVFRI